MTIALAVFAALLVLPGAFNGRFNAWGTTPAEVGMSLPGDELIASPSSSFAHAVTIDASPEKVWPWVVQIGMERAGWHTYDWFHAITRSAGFVDGHSSDRIVPELQGFAVGDVIKMNAAAGSSAASTCGA